MIATMGRWFAAAALAGMASILTSCSALDGERPAPTPSALEILESLRRDLIPSEGSPAGYGPDFSSEGYEVLRQWNSDIRPEAVWADDYARMDVGLPCCGAIHPYKDESQNCGCGHHQALYGLAKRLLQRGDDRTQVQSEIGRWRAFMFPRETLQVELERRALQDPAIRQALDELRQQGIC